MRTDYATRVFGDIRINVVVSAVVCVGALVYLVVVRKPREVLTGPAAAQRAEAPPEAAKADASGAPTGVSLEKDAVDLEKSSAVSPDKRGDVSP